MAKKRNFARMKHFYGRTVVASVLFILCPVAALSATDTRALASKAEAEKDASKAIMIYGSLMDEYKRRPTDYATFDRAFSRAGNLCYASQRYVEALEFYTLDIEAAGKCGNTHNVETSLVNIGVIYDIFGDYSRSMYYFGKARNLITRGKPDNSLLAGLLSRMIVSCCNHGHPDEAKKYFRQRAGLKTVDARENQYTLLYTQGIIAEAEKKYSAAIYYFNETLRFLAASPRDDNYDLPILIELGNCYLVDGDTRSAKAMLDSAARKATAADMHGYLADTYQLYAKLYDKLGKKDSAQIYVQRLDSENATLYNPEKINAASSSLLMTMDKEHAERVTALASTISTQTAVIIAFALLVVFLVVLMLVWRRQKRLQMDAYRLLLAKDKQLAILDKKSRDLREKYLDALAEGVSRKVASVEDVKPGSYGNLRQDKAEDLLRKINNVLDTPELVFSPDFNLDVLSAQVGSNTKYVSVVINETYGKNFKTILNERRIREAIHLLTEDDQYKNSTMMTIALAVGYKSATNFIAAFKRITGMTPAVYKNLQASKKNISKK